ncbi:MAG TPA: spermidine/putrescine ABC transporter ATP-binding protein [Clostridiales bacterium]|nr:spermidine/putrescine ABC transporter ATP-binding protein [Clostridiales bacterium]
MNEILELDRISLTYHTPSGEIPAIGSISFSVENGEFIAIIGPSGCGKTSILSIVAGLLKPSGGEVRINGKKVVKPDGSIGYMLQKDELFPWLTIEQNVRLPLEIKGLKGTEYSEKVRSLLKKYGLWEFRGSYPSELSGGMRQRAALIRTLSSSPDLLLLDEPFSALDFQTRISVCDDVYEIIKKEKKTAVLVTHDITEAISVADRIVVLTKRPSKILNIHDIDTDKTLSPLKRRENKDFSAWFERLWRELNYENK